MQIDFLELSKPITIEVAAGRCSVGKGKQLLKINSDIVVNNAVKERLRLWKASLAKYKNLAIDYPGELSFRVGDEECPP